MLMQLGFLTSLPEVFTVFGISLVLALVSWHGIEKQDLALKAGSPSALRTRDSIAAADP